MRVLYDDCGIARPVWSVDPDYITAAVVTFVIQTAAYSMRVLSRIMGLGSWGWDDHACAFAYVSNDYEGETNPPPPLNGAGRTMLTVVVAYLGALHCPAHPLRSQSVAATPLRRCSRPHCLLLTNLTVGHLGQYNNFWTLNFQNLSPFWKIDFSRAIAYAFALAACKTAILFFYKRIFERPGSRLRWVLWATHAFNVLLALSYMIQAFTIDRPLWCLWELDQESTCVYRDAYFGSGAYSALNALLDIVLVAIPAVMVSRLKMSTGRKLSVITVFATGTV